MVKRAKFAKGTKEDPDLIVCSKCLSKPGRPGMHKPGECPEEGWRPAPPPEPERRAVAAAPSDEDDEPPLTQLDAADHMVKRFKRELMFSPELGWMCWTGTHWKKDTTAGWRYAILAVRELTNPGAKMRSNANIRGTADLAGLHDDILIDVADIDRRDFLIQTASGHTISLHTGAVKRSRPENRLSQVIRVEYNPDATCPKWENFLGEIFAHDPELPSFVRRAVGYSMTGSVAEQVMFLLHGEGSNGKSVFLNILRRLTGDYGQEAPTEMLMRTRNKAHESHRARLKAARLVGVNETWEGGILDEAEIKALTGGDPITAKRLYREPFDFLPTHKVWLRTNHKPRILGTDDGIWRRLIVVPFLQSFTGARVNRDLEKGLATELPGILNWAIEGALEWREEGLNAPESVRAEREGYRTEENTFDAWLRECCVVETNAAEVGRYLHESYLDYSGDKATTRNMFSRKLTKKGFKPGKTSSGERIIQGIRLSQGEDRP